MAQSGSIIPQLNAEQFSTQDSIQTISIESASSTFNIQENQQFYHQSSENNEILDKVFNKYLVKVQSNESTFQIFRPKGDLQLPKDEEEQTDENTEKLKRKYKIYSQLLEPLQGQSFYSINTIKMKLKIDLLMLEQFDNNEL